MKTGMKRIIAFIMAAMMLFIVGCGGNNEAEVEPLKESNPIPADGIITKEQLMTVAGEARDVQFVDTLENGITYTWTFHANLIKNPQDQNLKIEFEEDVLDAVKDKVPEAVNAIGMKMAGNGLVAASTLSVTIPQFWNVSAAFFVKEENGALTEFCPVTVTRNKSDLTSTLTLNIATMEEECYIIGTDSLESNEQNTQTMEEVTTEKEKETTTEKKEETTTGKKQETTTAKKEETTTEKKQETTTSKKEEPTTAQKEETTTEKKEETTTEEPKLTCTISINCATILDNMDKLDPAKKSFVPSDGWILKKTTVTFEKGETVHDVLKRVCKEKGIHMESSYTPVYDSAYVEGINQLYEFDCGSQSGWMYKVNGWFPNYGSSQYEVSDGDEIAWVYTCDLGDDVGDNSMQ